MLRILCTIFLFFSWPGHGFIGEDDYLEWNEPSEVASELPLKKQEAEPEIKGPPKKSEEEVKKPKALIAPVPKKKKEKQKTVKKTPSKIIIALPHNYAPYSYIGKDGKIKGLYIKLLNEINMRMGDKLKFEAMTFEKGLDLSKDGIVGLVGLYKNKKREKIYDFSESLFSESIALYTRAGEEFDFDGFSTLQDKKVGIVKDYSYGDQFDKYKARKYFPTRLGKDENDLFDMLIQKSVDVILCDDIIANKILFQREIGGKVTKLNRLISNMDIYIVWAKDKAPKDFFKDLNYNLAVIQTNGVYSKILSHFIRTSFMDD